MYTDTLASARDRQKSLLQTYRFICKCSFCSLSSSKQKESDDNRLFIKQTIDTLSIVPVMSVPLDVMSKAVLLAEREKIFVYVTQLWYLGGCSLSLRGKNETSLQEAIHWLRKAKEGYTLINGIDGYHVRDINGMLCE